MNGYGAGGRYAEAPPDPPPSIFDSEGCIHEALEDAGYPDYVADMFAELIAADYSQYAVASFVQAVRRNVEPVVERYAGLLRRQA